MSTSDAIELRDRIIRDLRVHGFDPIDTAVAHGSRHTITAEVRRMEKRGEVAALWGHVLDERSGIRHIPYVRLRERSAVQRERWIRWTVFWIGIALGLAGVLYTLWTIRIFIIVTLGVAGVIALYLRYGHGCPGHRCPACGR